MSEVKILSHGEGFEYKGLIDKDKLYKVIKDWLDKKGYDPWETEVKEIINKDSKDIFLKIEPTKHISDYAQIVLKIEIQLNNLKEKVVKRNNIRHKLQEGTANFTFSTRLKTDKEDRWHPGGLVFFLKILIEKYVVRSYMDKLIERSLADKDALIREIKSYLNMYQPG